MPRDHSRIKVSMWDDQDVLNLTAADQHLYLTVSSQVRLSYCGVIDYIPGRFAVLAADLTQAKVKASARRLEHAKFFVIDRDTQELLVRSYVRHDGVLERVNMGKAVGTAFNRIASRKIRTALGVELARLMVEDPDLKGWVGLAETSPIAFAMALPMASGIASPIASREA